MFFDAGEPVFELADFISIGKFSQGEADRRKIFLDLFFKPIKALVELVHSVIELVHSVAHLIKAAFNQAGEIFESFWVRCS